MTMHERFKEIMKPQEGYTFKELRKLLKHDQSSMMEYFIGDAIASGIIEEVKPKDGINRTFRIKQ